MALPRDDQARERTPILLGDTVTQRADAKRLAKDAYQRRMLEIAEQKVKRLPNGPPMVRFAAYADTYARDVIALRRGARRELEMLKPLRMSFDARAAVEHRRRPRPRLHGREDGRRCGPRTINREVDVLKGMLRDAVGEVPRRSPLSSASSG